VPICQPARGQEQRSGEDAGESGAGFVMGGYTPRLPSLPSFRVSRCCGKRVARSGTNGTVAAISSTMPRYGPFNACAYRKSDLQSGAGT
jgi:hypothetical protein